MGTIELKSHIHKIVDQIENEQFLQTLYDFLKVKDENKAGELWKHLTEEQKQEVFLAYDESEEECNLIEREKVFSRT